MAQPPCAGQFATSPSDEMLAWPGGRPRGLDRGCDSREQVEEGPLALGGDAPVDGDELEAVVVVAMGGGAADTLARVEVTPRRVPTERRQKVVRRVIEREVVVLVKEDGLVVVPGQGARGIDLGGNQVGI